MFYTELYGGISETMKFARYQFNIQAKKKYFINEMAIRFLWEAFRFTIKDERLAGCISTNVWSYLDLFIKRNNEYEYSFSFYFLCKRKIHLQKVKPSIEMRENMKKITK